MRYAKRTTALLLALLTLLGALAGCGAKQDDDAAGNALRVCVCAPLESLDPALNADPDADAVFHALFENLLRVHVAEDGTRTLEPAVAKEYETVENFDGTVDYVFTLRSSARWSDGTRVKAKDFVYAWRRLVNPATESPNAALLCAVSGYEEARESGDATRLAVAEESESRFRVTLDAPCAWFLTDVCTAAATMPLRSDMAGKNADWATSAGSLLCNGAFRLSGWSKGESLYLRRNDHYYNANAVNVTTLRFVFAQSAEQRRRYYDEGLADYLSPVSADVEGAATASRRGVTCVLYNHIGDVFSNAHVRRAFDLAIDRAAVAALLGGGQSPATGLVPPGVVNARDTDVVDFRAAGGALIDETAEGYADRIVEARAEILDGGYWSGEAFPDVSVIFPEDDPVDAAVAAACARMWTEQLHVNVSAEGLGRAAFDERLETGEYDMAVDSYATRWGDAMDYLERCAGQDGANALHYASKACDLLIAVARDSRDLDARAAMLHDAEALLLGDTALSPVVFDGAGSVLREGMDGVRYDAGGCPYFDGVTQNAAS